MRILIQVIKRELNHIGRHKTMTDELENLVSKNLIKSFIGFRKYLYYQWNKEKDS